MIRKLRIKFICINMAIVTMMLLVIFGMVLHFTAENLEERSLKALTDIREPVFAGEIGGLFENRLPGMPEGLPVPGERVHLPWFRVSWDENGQRQIYSDGYGEALDEQTLETVAELARSSEAPVGLLKDYGLRYRKDFGPMGEGIFFLDISSEITTMNDLIRTSLFVMLVSLGLFLMLSILLARWAIRPVEEAWDRQRQFVADASHELKTPLTVIMTNAELLQDPMYEPEEKGAFAENILTMSRQMRFLVERLLELARVDNGTAKMERKSLSFSELVQGGLLPFEPVYFEKGLELEAEVAEGLRVRGDESRLKQVLEILLDNGAKYTQPGAAVWVRLRQQGSACLLSVAGPGEPISREDLTNIFRRFYRVDQARYRNGSYGLGLSIAESIVTEHGGRIWAESEGGINTFFVQLPAE